MQKKIQENEVLHEFSHYGIILYIFALILIFQAVLNIVMYRIMYYGVELFYISTAGLIKSISDWGFGISIGIVIFFLMFKTIKIHSKVREPATRNLTIFSILWFVFYAISYLKIIFPNRNPFEPPPNIPLSLIYVQFVTIFLMPIFQLLVWISLRKFLLDNGDIFPKKTTRSIRNSLIFLIFICTSNLFFLFVQTITTINELYNFAHASINVSFSILSVFSLLIYTPFTFTPMWILLIIGYSLLGLRLRKLKTTTDTSISEQIIHKKIQENQVLHKFSHYGIVLFIFAAIFLFQAVSNTLIYMDNENIIHLKYDSFLMKFLLNSNLIVGISSSIVIFILMIKAIMIHSKAHEPATRNLMIFSILWFVFCIIGNVINWLMNRPPFEPPMVAYNVYINYTIIQLHLQSYSPLFQLLVWISLRKFFLDRNDIFPAKTSRGIFNCLILLIFGVGMIFMGSTINYVYFIQFQYPNIYFSRFNLLAYVLPDILLIIGYSLLGYKLRTLKISTDTSNSER